MSQFWRWYQLPSRKLTAKAPENGWLEYDCFLLGRFGLFSGAMYGYVRFGEGNIEATNPFTFHR